MKLSFATTSPTIDVLNWSGTEYYMAKSLSKYFEMDYITDVKAPVFTLASIRKMCLYLQREGHYLVERSPEVAKVYAKQIETRMSPDVDAIFSPSSILLAYLKTNKPKVFYTDATFASILNYYDDTRKYCKQTVKEALALEKLALQNCDLAIYASDWAAQSAIDNLGADTAKIRVVPFGANLSEVPSIQVVQNAITKRSRDICKILFVGVDWERKGGKIVFDTVKRLNSMGLKTEMHIVGLDNLPEALSASFVVNHGFLNKNRKEDFERFSQILSTSHFMFVPSSAEAYGLMFCEASAYGIPSISSKTGGITTALRDGVNGRTFDLGTDPEVFAHYIYEIFNDRDAYEKLALSSYQEYLDRLNWDIAGKTMKNYLESLL